MRNRDRVVVAALLGITSAAQMPAQAPVVTAAIYPFEVQGSAQGRGWDSKAKFGDQAADAIRPALYRTADMNIFTREKLQQIAAEQGLRFDERFDRSTTPAFGKLAGVQAIVSGTIQSISAWQKSSKQLVSGQAANESVQRGAKVMMSLDIYSTESGQVVFSTRATLDTTESTGGATSGSLKALTCGVQGLQHLFGKKDKGCDVALGKESKTVPVDATAADALVAVVISNLADALADSVAKYMPKIVSKLPAPRIAATPIVDEPPQVAGEDSGEFVINRGDEAGLNVGDMVPVERLGKKFKVGAREIQPTTTIGMIQLTKVDRGWSRGRFRPGRADGAKQSPREGDIVKLPSRTVSGR